MADEIDVSVQQPVNISGSYLLKVFSLRTVEFRNHNKNEARLKSQMSKDKKTRDMKKIILSIALFSFFAAVYSATVTVNSSGLTFTPATITITLGDDVNFVISSSHDVLEVSEATWTANGKTPLAGGFSAPFGGGLIPASKLTVGTHYYVCEPHASSGMKGTIIVQGTTGIAEKHSDDNFSVFPNPSNGNFKLKINTSKSLGNYDLQIYDVRGKAVFGTSGLKQHSDTQLDLANLPKGTYFVRLFNKSEMYTRKIVIR